MAQRFAAGRTRGVAGGGREPEACPISGAGVATIIETTRDANGDFVARCAQDASPQENFRNSLKEQCDRLYRRVMIGTAIILSAATLLVTLVITLVDGR